MPAEQQGNRIYTEADWNPMTYDEAMSSNDRMVWYSQSKMMGEKAAQEIASKARFTCAFIWSDPSVYFCVERRVVSHEPLYFISTNSFSHHLCMAILSSRCDSPPMVFGPLCTPFRYGFSQLNLSTAMLWELMNGTRVKTGIPATSFPWFADVRDVALAHVLTAERCLSGRFIVAGGEYDNTWLAQFARTQVSDT